MIVCDNCGAKDIVFTLSDAAESQGGQRHFCGVECLLENLWPYGSIQRFVAKKERELEDQPTLQKGNRMIEEDDIRRLAYQIAQERLRNRPPPLGGPNAALPHRMDVEAAMDEARSQLTASNDQPTSAT